MKIAILSGASSGIGKRFCQRLSEYGRFDEVWLIARHADKLAATAGDMPFPVRCLPLDLTKAEDMEQYAARLETEKPEVALLMNISGFGKFAAVMDTPLDDNLNMVDLNCKAVLAMCQLTVPYMPRGSQIVNISSVAAFQPIPYIDVYGATKAFVLSFSRALNRELAPQGIAVLAVCPYWTKTDFFDRAIDPAQQTVVKKYIALYTPDDVVNATWKAIRRGRDYTIVGFKAKAQTLLAKLLPHSLIMTAWMKQQKLG